MHARAWIRLLAPFVLATLDGTATRAQQADTPAFKRTSVEALNTSGKLQRVEFYHPTGLGCQQRLPIVQGLEKTLAADYAFLYFDISLPATGDIQKRPGFKSTPPFFWLSPNGKVLSERSGVIPATEFDHWLRSSIGK